MLECRPSEEVGITLTNLGEKEIEFNEKDVMWKIVREDDPTKVMHIETANWQLKLKGGDSYTWVWKIPSNEEGVYRVYRAVRKGEQPLVPLFRKLRIRKLRALSQ